MGQPSARDEGSTVHGFEGSAAARLPDLRPGQWLVSSSEPGEELAAEAERNGVLVLLFGTPKKPGDQPLESRLSALLEAAEADVERDTGPRPLPGAIHHTVTRLIGWLGEIDGVRGRSRMSALVLFESQEHLAFAVIGGGEAEVQLDGHRVEPEWTRIGDRKGREALGLTFYARPRLCVRMDWKTSRGGSAGEGRPIRAEWTGSDHESARPKLELFASPASPSTRVEPRAVEAAPTFAPAQSEAQAPPKSTPAHSALAPAGDVIVAARASATPAPLSIAEAAAAIDASAALVPSGPLGDAPAVEDPSSETPGSEGEGDEAIDPTSAPIGGNEAVVRPASREISSVADSGSFFQWLDGVVAKRRESGETSEAASATPSTSEIGQTTSSPGAPPSLLPPIALPAATSAPAMPGAEPDVPKRSFAIPSLPHDRVGEALGSSPPSAASAADVSRSPAPPAIAARPAAREAHAPAPPAIETPMSSPVSSPISSAPDLEDENLLVARPEPRAPRAARRPEWPALEPARERPSPRIPILIGTIVVLLFAVGWLLGRVQSDDVARGASPLVKALRAVGLAPARFEARIASRPDGAWIAVDGKSVALKTPATVELVPGVHSIELSLPDLGSARYEVQGRNGGNTQVQADLAGTLSIRSDTRRPIQVSVDGVDRGFAPVILRGLEPGAHEVRFSAAGSAPWGQTLTIGVREDAEILTRPFESPATGVVEVRATENEDDGVQPMRGAVVFVDGKRRGVTPLTLELPSGPHSLRVVHGDEQAPIQVIDLPGGNQRFATFPFGVGGGPRLTLTNGPAAMPRDRTTLISASLDGVTGDEVREMWLHVRTPEKLWRRYPMTPIAGSGAAAGAVVFPLALLDASGRAPYYVSASTTLGDEYFTELQNPDPPPPAKGHHRTASSNESTPPPLEDSSSPR